MTTTFAGSTAFPGPGTEITGTDFEFTYTGRSCDGAEANLLLCPLMEFVDGDEPNQDVSVSCAGTYIYAVKNEPL